MKTLSVLLLSMTLVAGSVAHAASPALTGTWKSVNAEGKALPGVIELRTDGSAVLAPEGETRLEGTWATEKSNLVLTMPPYGTASMEYSLDKKGLTLTYENGVKQRFIKKSTTKK